MSAKWAAGLVVALGLGLDAAGAQEPLPADSPMPMPWHLPGPGAAALWHEATGWVAPVTVPPWPCDRPTPAGAAEGCGPYPYPACYGSAEYLLWWVKHYRIPAVLTTGSPDQFIPGALGNPDTVVLAGGSIDPEERSGARFTAGYWLDGAQTWALEGNYFFLGKRSIRLGTLSNGGDLSPPLSRPFFSTLTEDEDADLVAFPGETAGGVMTTVSNRMWGSEANVRLTAWSGCCYRLGFLGGFRFLKVDEDLDVLDSRVDIAPAAQTNHSFVSDSFSARNAFYGAQVGSVLELCHGCWGVDLKARVAVGEMDEQVRVHGETVIIDPQGTVLAIPRGFLALPTNSSLFNRDKFAVVPEGNVNFNCRFSDNCRLQVGYTILYVSELARPGDQVDRVINPSQLPSAAGAGSLVGPPRPAFPFRGNDFWAQGLSLGIEVRY